MVMETSEIVFNGARGEESNHEIKSRKELNSSLLTQKEVGESYSPIKSGRSINSPTFPLEGR